MDMTYQEVAALVDSLGYPNAYYEFPDGTEQAPPFVAFFFEAYSYLYADDRNYAEIGALSIEFYDNAKNFEAEAHIEQVLTAAGLTWAKAETPIDSERLYEVIYSADIVIRKEEE